MLFSWAYIKWDEILQGFANIILSGLITILNALINSFLDAQSKLHPNFANKFIILLSGLDLTAK